MTTSIDRTQHYDAAPEAVLAMVLDPDFVVQKCLASGSISAEATVNQDGDVAELVSDRVLPAKLPGFAKKFVGDTLTLTETQRWTTGADGNSQATFSVDFGNNPITFSGTVSMRVEGSQTVVHTKGAVKCSVPFVGGKIEGVAAEWIDKYLAKEQTLGTEWLAAG